MPEHSASCASLSGKWLGPQSSAKILTNSARPPVELEAGASPWPASTRSIPRASLRAMLMRANGGPQMTRPRLETDLIHAALRVPDAILLVNNRGVVVLVNDACRALLGFVQIGSHLVDAAETYKIEGADGTRLPPMEIPLARALFRRERVIDEPCRISRPSGRVVDLVATAIPLDDERGHSVGAMLTLREASRLSPPKAPVEVVSAERRFQALAAATAQTIWTTNAVGVVAADSPSWRAFTGQTWEEYRGFGWLDALHEDERERARVAWLAAVASRASYEVEYRMRRHDGAFRWTLARGTPVLDATGRVVEWIGCNWDVHAIKEAERNLERIVEFQQILLAIVGHDLKNPLSAILVGAGLLQGEGATAGVRRTADLIARSALRANQIVGLLLDLAEGKLGKGLTIHREEVDVAAIAKQIVDELDGSIAGRPLVLTYSGDTVAALDPARVGQVLSNLIGNALHHGKPATDVRVLVTGTPNAIEIAVDNAGEPICEQRLKTLFTPFGGLSSPPSNRRNLGLGLHIVKTIVDAHEGTVGVDSASGRITFRVCFPRP